jgi:thioredoxin reductase (NADPH)
MKEYKTKLLVIGSGPAGATACIYGARANLNPILVQGITPGGQLTITTEVENYPGFANAIMGPYLMEQMMEQAKNVGTEIISDHIISLEPENGKFIAKGMSGDLYIADSVIISTGAQAKWLGLPSEQKYQGFGVSGCATCDGFFFKNKNVIVVGGGNTAVEEALYLTNHAKKVTLIHRRDSLRAEKILQDRMFKNPKIEIIWNHTVEEIIGTETPKSVTAIIIKNTQNSEISKIQADGVFIAIGHKPNTDIFKNLLEMDEENYIITKPDSTQTNIEGIFAAGDVQDKIYRQAVTAAGTGCMAALEAMKYLAEQE